LGHRRWLLMGVGMLLIWALVVAGIVWLVHHATSNRAPGGVSLDKPAAAAQPSAQDILDQRYARGEINDEEHRIRRDTLAAQ
jgi:putative membrane protein